MATPLDKKMLVLLPFIESIVQLFHPFVEVAVHDLSEVKVIVLYHNISQRKIGNPITLGGA